MSPKPGFSLILFDLDGTLVDSAPDLGSVLNRLLLARGQSALPLESYRTHVSKGAQGLLHRAFGLGPESPDYPDLLKSFLDLYQTHLAEHSVLFEGMPALLADIEDRGFQWGVITNKRHRFTSILMERLGLEHRATCIVSSDTTAEPKPSPLPMRHALSIAGKTADEAIYLGDDQRDVLAGKSVHITTGAVTYGYHSPDNPPENWGADYLFDSPAAIHAFLKAGWNSPN